MTDSRAPERTAETLDAGITALLRRTLGHAEALAREVREALGEDAYDSPCRRHGWRNCEDITCRQIAEIVSAAVAAERERIAQLAEDKSACYAAKLHGMPYASFADLIRETP